MRWFALALLLGLGLGGCTPSQLALPPADAASSSRIVSTPRQAPATAGADLPLAKVDFSCRLPVSTLPDRQGVFINFPSGSVSNDPKGKGGRFYDRAYARWLPVDRNAVTGDGGRYAYFERPPGQGKSGWMHIVDVATGTDHRFPTSAEIWPAGYVVVDFAVEGVYLAEAWEGELGLWLMDPASGSITRVANIGGFQVHGTEREFWVGSVNPKDQHPVGGMEIQPDQVDRLDLSDGYRETWLYRPGATVDVLGLDQGDHPIVQVINGNGNGLLEGDHGAELVLLLAPDQNRLLFKGAAELVTSLGAPEADGNGIWFGSQRGIYLYTPGAGLRKVSNQAGYPAGFCI